MVPFIGGVFDGRFHHKPLDLNQRQIRLVQILRAPAGASTGVRCKIENVSLDDKPVYKALSYTWGEPDPSSNIVIEGRLLSVRQNLYEFLTMAQSQPELSLPTRFWIDQITIDQDNKIERNHQVQQMGDIYSNAEEVVIWLGQAFPGSGGLMTALQSRSSNLKNDRDSRLKPQNHRAALEQVFDNSYWTRLWVCQEMLLAKRLQMYLGSRSLDLDTFDPNVSRRGGLLRTGEAEYADRLSVMLVVRGRSHFGEQGASQRSWHSVLLLTAGCQCSEPRDQVFALLSMLGEVYQVPVNYRRSLREVWMTTVAKIAAGWIVEKSKEQMRIFVGVAWVLWNRLGLIHTTSSTAHGIAADSENDGSSEFLNSLEAVYQETWHRFHRDPRLPAKISREAYRTILYSYIKLVLRRHKRTMARRHRPSLTDSSYIPAVLFPMVSFPMNT
ncbi:HET-domain-containing protein [Rhizodiscina lignyota]|uniref:HET-domain-containing protein n=1 Tax=Rhizodiscina lignyota TaxID=1504668 RepID=A0A9P4IJK8_9PEZI|nr:HET-domain-containing protein [Rhizodiscina lignyota]